MAMEVAGPGAPVARQKALRPSEGLRAGIVGATAIWLWLAVVDLVERTPLHTSEVLGRGFLVLILRAAPTPLWADVLAFTVLHYALWALVGSLLVRAIAADRRQPGVLIFATFLLILLLLAVIVIAALFAQTALRGYAWPSILGGHVIGLLAVGFYLRHRHPGLAAMLRREGSD